MTDANLQDPKGEKKEEEPEKPRSSATESGQTNAQTTDSFVGWAGEPEKPRSSVTETGLRQPLSQGDSFAGWAGFDTRKKEWEPEKPRSSVTEAGQSSAQRAVETTSLLGRKGKKTERKPEKPLSSVMEPGLTSAEAPAEVASEPVSKGGKREWEPEKPRSSATEAGHSNAQGTAETASLPGIKEEKPEGEPEKLHDSAIQPGQGSAQGAAPEANAQGASNENGEEKPEPLRYSVIEPPPEPPRDFAKSDLRLPASASAAATEKDSNSEPAASLPPAQQAPIEPVEKLAPNRIKVYILAVIGIGLLFGCIIAFFSRHGSSPEEPYDLGPVTSSGTGLRGHLYTRWDKKLEYRLSFGPSAPEQQTGFSLSVAHSPSPLSIDIHLQDAQGFVLCSREVILKYDGGESPAAPGAPNPDATGGKANVANPGDPPAHGIQDLLAAQEATRELGKEVFKNEIGPDGQITGINAQGEIPCTEKVYANASSWSFTTNFPSLAEQAELGKHHEEVQVGEEHPPAKASPRKKAAVIPPPVLLSFSIEGDDAIEDFDLSSGVMETRDHKTFLVSKAIGISLDSRWLEFPVSIHYKCDQTSACILTHAGAGALPARLKR